MMFVILLTSCKEKSSPKQENTISVEPKKELIIRMGFKTSVADVFKINLNNIEVDEFQKMNIQIREAIPVSTQLKSVIAKFVANNISNHIIIHLGDLYEKEVLFNGIEVLYGTNNILITNANFNKYFRLNKYVIKDSVNYSFKTHKVNGKHNPEIIARKYLIDFLRKEK